MTKVHNTQDMVTISASDYIDLLTDQELLSNLHAVGVDNWDGYGQALRMMGMDGDDNE